MSTYTAMTRWRAATGTLFALLLVGVLASAGCDDDGEPLPGTTTSTGTGGDGGGLNLGGSSAGGFDACATASIEGDRIPVQMYIMFDQSGSMLFEQKWSGASAALIAFFQDETSAGIGVALRFFPDDDPVAGCNETDCDASACQQPLVALGELNAQPAHSDPQQAALVDAVLTHSPQTNALTPMYPALAGATAWGVANVVPDKKTVVVLVTDGEPNGCNEDIGAIAMLASDAYANAEVRTYVIGMQGAVISQLDQIAVAGGTGQAFVVGGGTNVHKDIVAAFEKIGIAPLECELPMPEPENVGQEVNPDFVNVSFTPSDGGDAMTIPRVSGESDCASGGWYYDSPTEPTMIILCPSTCQEVQGDPGATLEVVLGCATVVK